MTPDSFSDGHNDREGSYEGEIELAGRWPKLSRSWSSRG